MNPSSGRARAVLRAWCLLAAGAAAVHCSSSPSTNGEPPAEDASSDSETTSPAPGSDAGGGGGGDASTGGADAAASPGKDAAAAGSDAQSSGEDATAKDSGNASQSMPGADAASSAPDVTTTAAGDGGGATYMPCPTDGTNCKILPLGDSITFGIQFAGAYRVQLFQDAVNAKKKITFVGDPTLANGPTTVAGMPFPQDNQGHSGWTIAQIEGIVPMPALQPLPDIILLHIGTNDMYTTTNPLAQAPQRLGMLIDSIVANAPKALLVVAQITPLQNATWEASVETYNAALPAIVSARAMAGKHVMLIDQHTGFVVATMLSSDGIHPNETGYNHMGDNWFAAIQSVLP